MQHVPRKRFGQNFLVDQNIVSKILGEINPQKKDLLVEIGPGLGALTKPIIDRELRLHAIEIDRDIAKQLAADFSSEHILIHNADALKFDFSHIGKHLRIFGNLPYNISTPLLFHLADYADCVKDVHVMLQKEVVERIIAKPSTPEYGRLSVMLQYRFAVKKLFGVSPQSFRPIPKVDSGFLRLVPLSDFRPAAQEYALFSEVVTRAFGKRRKMLRNALKDFLNDNDFAVLSIDPGARAENIPVAGFVAITRYLTNIKGWRK